MKYFTLEQFISEILQRTSNGSIPECISYKALNKEITDIKNNLCLPELKRTTNSNLILHMINASVIHEINLDYSKDNLRYFYIGLKKDMATLDPIELLSAFCPDGVLCFFSAMQYYELTTQFSPYYHIAKVNYTKIAPKQFQNIDQNGPEETIRSKNGIKYFSYKSTPYYLTNRNIKTIPGNKIIFFKGREYKIVTLEQLLIDCLLYPLKSGGFSVINEVWETASRYLKQSEILKILTEINRNDINQKTGYMLDLLDIKIEESLYSFLRKNISNECQLLYGYNFVTLNEKWKVYVL